MMEMESVYYCSFPSTLSQIHTLIPAICFSAFLNLRVILYPTDVIYASMIKMLT